MRALTFVAVLMSASMALAQSSHRPRMHSSGPTLFIAQATGGAVVPPQASKATATAAIIVDRAKGSISYDITFNGLERGAASRIGLYNFGAGKNGGTVLLLCGGDGAPACPRRPSARIAADQRKFRMSNALFTEFITRRVYLQIDGGDGRPEIRGQLAFNDAMVPTRNYLAHLVPATAAGATGEGTAVLFETYLPRGQVGVEYSVTVAGTSGTPEAIALVGVSPTEGGGGARFLKSAGLPNARRLLGASARTGGTFSGRYLVRSAGKAAPFPDKLLQASQAPALTVKTSRFPRGELAGLFKAVE